jgi:TolB-like protein/DNA-binding winged helix-turn-helix (wHTH) protein/cytochrome c-type biogenesis protein CcmH/NrfG
MFSLTWKGYSILGNSVLNFSTASEWGKMATAQSQLLAVRVKFSRFELDLRSGELISGDRKLRLQEQSFRLLKILLERAGEVLTREELQGQLWSAETFVDFDHGLHKAIAKLRDILDDPGSTTSLIETLPRRGYRFVPAVEWITSPTTGAAPLTNSGLKPVPSGRRYWLITAVSLLIALAVFLLSFRDRLKSKPAAIHAIAVLPLVNLSGDPAQEYFTDGMTDELITMLAKNTSLRVVSRTSVMRYKGVSRPVHEIARELGTDGILEGSVSRSGNRMHLTVQLVQGEKDEHIWAESYDRDLSKAPSLLSELSQAVAREVNVAVAPQARPQHEISSAAHDAYLRGRQFWFDVDYGKSQDLFERAIHLQPDYAAAWSGLADSYTVRAVAGEITTSEVRDKAQTAARKALELDPDLGEAHKAMAAVHYFLEWNWKDAEAESQRALELTPNDPELHHLRSYILGTLGRSQEALEEQVRASELDPDLRPWALGRALMLQGKFEDAIQELHSKLETHPHDITIRFMLANAYHLAGRARDSIHERAQGYRAMGDVESAQTIQRLFEKSGEIAAERWELARWKKRTGNKLVDPVGLAGGYARAKDKDSALRMLEAAYAQRSAPLVWIQDLHDFDYLHSEPRYRTIVLNMGLTPNY